MVVVCHAGVTRVRFSRGWTSMWTKDNVPILVPADESDAQAVAEYRIRSPSMLMADLDPWSAPQAENAVGLVPLEQIRVSDGGETFVETSSTCSPPVLNDGNQSSISRQPVLLVAVARVSF